jgi:hypothetical protein
MALAFSALSFTGTYSLPFFKSSNNFGEMVNLSHPQSYLISPVFLKEAPMTIVLISNFLK